MNPAFQIEPNEIPAIRISTAIGKRCSNNLLIVVGGGVGDQVCAEPTVRYTIDRFPQCSVSIYTPYPELFKHLDLKDVYTKLEGKFIERYLPLYTYAQGNIANQLFNANLMNSVDFASISALRMILPSGYTTIKSSPRPPDDQELTRVAMDDKTVLVHPGKTWESRTFPGDWWTKVAASLTAHGLKPVWIGSQTVDVDPGSALEDLRGKTSLNDLMWLCQNSSMIVTNDSSPFHLSLPGRAKIAVVPTCRSPDYLMPKQPRNFTKAFYKEKMWMEWDICPNHLRATMISKVPDGKRIEDYLPNPNEIASWLSS